MKYVSIIPRARIGFIIPTSNRMVEPQMTRLMPAGVVPHFTRIRMTNKHAAPLDQLVPRIVDASEMLAESKCDVIVLQCTGTSMSSGVETEKEVMAAIEKATGCHAVSAASSLMAAFAALKAKKLVFISEASQALHEKKLSYLREAGFTLLADKAVSLPNSDAFCTAPPELWFNETMALQRDDADAYFISCANIHSVDVIEDLERSLGKPVVTSNQAALWRSLRQAGIFDSVPGLGHLLRHDAVA